MTLFCLHDHICWMLRCSLVALLLNPLAWLLLLNPVALIISWQMLVMCLCFLVVYILPYITVGCAVWCMLRNRKWQLQTFAIWFSVNAVILSVIFLYSWSMMSSQVRCLSPLVFIIPLLSVIGALSSAIPIGYFCKHYPSYPPPLPVEKHAECGQTVHLDNEENRVLNS